MGKIPGTPYSWPVPARRDQLIVSPQVYAEYQRLMGALSAGSYSAAPPGKLEVVDLHPVMQNVTFDDKKLLFNVPDDDYGGWTGKWLKDVDNDEPAKGDLPPPEKEHPKCTVCWSELLPELDAYYGNDSMGSAMCSPCRKNLGIK